MRSLLEMAVIGLAVVGVIHILADLQAHSIPNPFETIFQPVIDALDRVNG